MQLERNLSNARVCSRGHVAKVAVSEVPHRVVELGVVHDIEEFCPELHRDFFGDFGVLMQGHVPIIQSWTMEKAAARVAEYAVDGIAGV